MKPINILTAIVFTIFAISCGEKTAEKKDEKKLPDSTVAKPAPDPNMPEAAATRFKADYPDVTDAKWEKEGDRYEVEWVVNDMEMEVIYDKEGNVLAKEWEIPMDSLPKTVMKYLKTNHPDRKFDEAEMVEKEGARFYELEFEADGKETELLFSADGKLVNTTEEEADGDDEDDKEEEK